MVAMLHSAGWAQVQQALLQMALGNDSDDDSEHKQPRRLSRTSTSAGVRHLQAGVHALSDALQEQLLVLEHRKEKLRGAQQQQQQQQPSRLRTQEALMWQSGVDAAKRVWCEIARLESRGLSVPHITNNPSTPRGRIVRIASEAGCSQP